MKALTKDAYAKINLFLDIDAKREDGYHNIISVMQSVGLCDTITVEYEECEQKIIEISCSNPDIPLGDKNIAYKTANLLLDSGHVRIHIEKRIPASAGLAGGSTDAAAVLMLLNQLIGQPKTQEELLSLGAKIGADVPFCMLGGTKLTLGIGERISDFTPMPDCHIVIACMGEGVSTPWAYAKLDKMNGDFKNYTPRRELLSILEKNDGSYYSGMFNIFESAVLPERPMAQKIKSIMLEYGAVRSMMSGSGPSVFGIFSSENEAISALEALKGMGADAHICRPV
ncbi:MAG: 4-(cytidine 5'-diphospho)-2-C-methyl-D-erythritol kinase [Clostridia bacterium]|nr:4-(cytidine 5'-diphospho)-2-C-methyl-D-erythritol kinase [Clostridia bacterium]